MVETFHIAAQYLATVAISFLDKKEDDSHTNLGWKDGSLYTHLLNDHSCTLSLDYKTFSLILKNDDGYREQLFLNGKTHFQIITWIRGTTLQAKLNKLYEYKLDYELPYKKLNSDEKLSKPLDEEIDQFIKKRNFAQQAIETTLENLNIDAKVRVWPHHFDSGAFFMATDEIGIGLGMAIPDSMIDDFYFYVSGYKEHESIILSESTSLDQGKYYSEGWKGFALPVSDTNLEQAIDFLTLAIYQYVKK